MPSGYASAMTGKFSEGARDAAVNREIAEIVYQFFPGSGFGVESQVVATSQGAGNALV
jgi:hypothetical protein